MRPPGARAGWRVDVSLVSLAESSPTRFDYSCLSAVSGLTRIARRAGK